MMRKENASNPGREGKLR